METNSMSMRWSQDRMSVQLLLNGKYRAINKHLKPVLFDDLKPAIEYAQSKTKTDQQVVGQ